MQQDPAHAAHAPALHCTAPASAHALQREEAKQCWSCAQGRTWLGLFELLFFWLVEGHGTYCLLATVLVLYVMGAG